MEEKPTTLYLLLLLNLQPWKFRCAHTRPCLSAFVLPLHGLYLLISLREACQIIIFPLPSSILACGEHMARERPPEISNPKPSWLNEIRPSSSPTRAQLNGSSGGENVREERRRWEMSEFYQTYIRPLCVYISVCVFVWLKTYWVTIEPYFPITFLKRHTQNVSLHPGQTQAKRNLFSRVSQTKHDSHKEGLEYEDVGHYVVRGASQDKHL